MPVSTIALTIYFLHPGLFCVMKRKPPQSCAITDYSTSDQVIRYSQFDEAVSSKLYLGFYMTSPV